MTAPSSASAGHTLSPSQRRVLTRVLDGTQRADYGMLLSPLRAGGPLLLAACDWLEQHEYLRKATVGHVVSMVAMPQLRSEKAVKIVSDARTIYTVLRRHYRDHQKEALAVSEIAALVDLPQAEVANVLCYMLHVNWSCGQTVSLHDPDSGVNVGEDVVKFRSFDALLAREEAWRASRKGQPWGGIVVAPGGLPTVAPRFAGVVPAVALPALHPRVAAVAAPLLNDGHHAAAIYSACIMLEQLVQERAKRNDLSGAALMRTVFSVSTPVLRFDPLSPNARGGEQEGMMQLYVGAMLALRNPRAHAIVEDGAQRARDVLGFVSFLCHSLDRAEHVPPPA